MKFQIGVRGMKDKSVEGTIMKTFEYFATINYERSVEVEKRNNKSEVKDLLQELVNYVELGLKKKFSINFTVIISNCPNYAVKYEKGCLLSLSYSHYEIIIFRVPYITIPSKFHKVALTDKEQNSVTSRKALLTEGLISKNDNALNVISYYLKVKGNEIKYSPSSFTKEFLSDIVMKNISYCCEKVNDGSKGKDFISTLVQSIQYDLSDISKDYSFCCIIAKDIIISPSFTATSNLVYLTKFEESSDILKSFELNKLKGMEILIYHKNCEFESPLKNIITGRFHSVEIKHIFILISVIIFFSLVGFCPGEQSSYLEKTDLTWFEEKVCKNKSSYLSTIGVLFIMIVLSGVLKKRINKNKKNN